MPINKQMKGTSSKVYNDFGTRLNHVTRGLRAGNVGNFPTSHSIKFRLSQYFRIFDGLLSFISSNRHGFAEKKLKEGDSIFSLGLSREASARGGGRRNRRSLTYEIKCRWPSTAYTRGSDSERSCGVVAVFWRSTLDNLTEANGKITAREVLSDQVDVQPH